MSVRLEAETALLIDVGSAWAKAGVIGRVRGRWRLVAHASQPTSWGPNELRVRLAEQLAGIVDNRLAHRLDELLASANRIECHTARQPGRLAVVAVSREVSGSAARRAAEAAGWEVAGLVTLDDARSLADRLAMLQVLEVDAWLVAGGFDGARSLRAVEAAALVAAVRRRDGGPVIWAGSDELVADVVAMFEPDSVEVANNPRPDARRDEPAALRDLLQAVLRRTMPWEEEMHLASVTFPRAIGTLAAASGLRVLAVDLGARTAMRVVADLDGTVACRVHAGGGLAGTVLVPGAPARISRMAGDAGEEAAVADLLQTLRARPASLPQTPEELSATQTAARVQLASLMVDGPGGPFDLVIGAGSTIACAPHPGQAVRMLLDGVRPIGVTQLAVDSAAVLGPLGSLPDDEIREGMALLADDLLLPLGTSVVSRGGDPGQVAMRVTVHRPGWPASGPFEVRVGQLQVVALGRGQQAELAIELGDGVSLGAARRSSRITAMATGGSVGLILDARGTPIALPRRGDDRRAVLAGWQDALEREVIGGVERVA